MDVKQADVEAPANAVSRAGTRTTRDLVLSLAVVLLVIGVLIVLTPRRHYDAVHQIDYTQQLRDAREVAPFHILAPVGLSPRWRATSVRYAGNVHGEAEWHLGFVSPRGEYVGLEESSGPRPRTFAFNLASGGDDTGSLLVHGAVWRRYYKESRDIRSIGRIEGSVAYVVTGTAGYDELVELAEALR